MKGVEWLALTLKELKAEIVWVLGERSTIMTSLAAAHELGYFEFRTTAKVKEALEMLELTADHDPVRRDLKIVPGPTVALIGEPDDIPGLRLLAGGTGGAFHAAAPRARDFGTAVASAAERKRRP